MESLSGNFKTGPPSTGPIALELASSQMWWKVYSWIQTNSLSKKLFFHINMLKEKLPKFSLLSKIEMEYLFIYLCFTAQVLGELLDFAII